MDEELNIWQIVRLLFWYGLLPVLQPCFDKLNHFIVNLADVLGLAFMVLEPVFVPVMDTT